MLLKKTEKKIDAYSAIKDINGAYEINVGISLREQNTL
ncbi:hypothetical protein SpAn4DRAFT_4287 [Sporomusa ovata]|uniref:Uncharacterized protein n=1 Tax=Sporomusa ovata TaxID=2378 RepID=A0A0U1L5J3_9FIRM|nr:hypothetical protein SpAn4DRAFT_4287 [Sporomusa ovata]